MLHVGTILSAAVTPVGRPAAAAVRRRIRRRLATQSSSQPKPPDGASTSGGRSVLFLSPTLWPEPSSSAAGVRTTSLLRRFASADDGLFETVHYGSGAPRRPAADPSQLNGLPSYDSDGVRFHSVPANRSSAVEDLLSSPEFDGLSAVVFDRFFAEEAYSHHVRRFKPHALRVLDMQDFHSLRAARRALVEDWPGGGGGQDENDSDAAPSLSSSSSWMTDGLMDDVMGCVPSHAEEAGRDLPPPADPSPAGEGRRGEEKKKKRGRNDARDVLLRELASVHRSDLTFVCSPHERDLLADAFGIDPAKLCVAPFFTSAVTDCYDGDLGRYDRRADFVALGGFSHPPNVDSVRWLRAEVWPRVRSELPGARVHVHGSYPPRHVLELNDERSGFLVKGRLDDVGGELSRRRVLLAPLRYGAGIKGKVIDSWRYGCPVVTTPVGAEGATVDRAVLRRCTVRSDGGGDWAGGTVDAGWGGLIGTDADAVARCAVRLYRDRDLWDEARSNARRLLQTLFDEGRNLDAVSSAICGAMDNLNERRSADHSGAVLWHHSARSTEYFSRWIELKEMGVS